MHNNDAVEQAYNNGYAAGYRAALQMVRDELDAILDAHEGKQGETSGELPQS